MFVATQQNSYNDLFSFVHVCIVCLCNVPVPNDVTTLYRSIILQDLLKRFVSTLKDPVWNEVETAMYHRAAAAGLKLLSQLLYFPHLERRGSTLSSSVAKAVRVVKKLCSLSMTKELIEMVFTLAQGKVSMICIFLLCPFP